MKTKTTEFLTMGLSIGIEKTGARVSINANLDEEIKSQMTKEELRTIKGALDIISETVKDVSVRMIKEVVEEVHGEGTKQIKEEVVGKSFRKTREELYDNLSDEDKKKADKLEEELEGLEPEEAIKLLFKKLEEEMIGALK